MEPGDAAEAEKIDKRPGNSFICALCMSSFVTKKELRDHYRGVHKDSLLHPDTKHKRIERRINRHLCGQCGKHFGDQWTLSHHQMTVHSESRQHGCRECDKAFLSKKDLVRHHRGVHLKQRITFPGSKESSRLVSSRDITTQSPTSDKVTKLPNILRYSKLEKKIVIPPVICKPKSSSLKQSSVVRVIGLEKTQKKISVEETLSQESEPGLSEEQPQPQAPVFQLENLENLQLVVPDPAEEQSEPRIIIPETGIRLTISGAGESEDTLSGRKILHLIPDSSLTPYQEQSAEPFKQFESQEVPIKDPTITIYKKGPVESSPMISLPGSSLTGDQFSCPSCSKLFISKDFLDKHINSFHSEVSPFSISYVDVDSLQEQSLGSIDEIDMIENLTAGSPSDILKKGAVDVLLSNTSSKVEVVSDFPCNSCSERFESKATLQRHKKTSHRKRQQYKCEDCESVFTSNQTLKAHVQSVHEGIKKVCSICLKPVFDLTRHIRDQHKNGDKREYHCDICSGGFRTNFSLQRHKENVHLKLKAWSCDLCDKSFGEKRDMNRHKHAVHFGIKNKLSIWSCPECQIQFKLRREYDDHKASYHSQLSEQQIVKFLNSEMEAKAKQKFQIQNVEIL